jgi:hypothetical protein
MKINEINQPKQIDEGIGSALIGDRAAAAVRGFFSGKGTKHTMYQQAFLKDFYQDAITSLDNGIQGGFIDKNATSNLGGGEDNKEVDPKRVNPTAAVGAGTGAGTGAGATAAAANKNQQQTNQTLNNYIKKAASTINKTTDKRQKVALTKELVNAMADRKGYPEWENALATVQQVIKRGNVDPNFATTAINNLKAGTTMAESYQIYYINKLVESVGLTWNDIGLCVIKKNNNLYLAEQKFAKMNNLFESIMQLKENQGISIAEYMKNWFDKYMHNTNPGWENFQSQVLPMLQQIQDTYSKDKGKAAIKQLAKTALAISKLSPMPPKGAENVIQGADAKKADNPLKTALNRIGSGGGATDPEQLATKISDLSPESQKQIAAQIDAFKAAGK